jgi:hypothetical protein
VVNALRGIPRASEEVDAVRAVFVLNHGNNGSAQDWDLFASILIAAHNARFPGQRAIILQADCNSFDTHGGIPLLGTRLADEIQVPPQPQPEEL